MLTTRKMKSYSPLLTTATDSVQIAVDGVGYLFCER